MQKWQYTWGTDNDIKALGIWLNQKGEQGWELVSVTQAFSDERGTTVDYYTAFLKRAKQ